MTNSDVQAAAASLLEEAKAIPDEYPQASARRMLLYRAAAHLLKTSACLEELADLPSADASWAADQASRVPMPSPMP